MGEQSAQPPCPSGNDPINAGINGGIWLFKTRQGIKCCTKSCEGCLGNPAAWPLANCFLSVVYLCYSGTSPHPEQSDSELYYHKGKKEENSLPTFLSLCKELNNMFKPYVGFVWGRTEQEGQGQISFLICTRKMVVVYLRKISKNAINCQK